MCSVCEGELADVESAHPCPHCDSAVGQTLFGRPAVQARTLFGRAAPQISADSQTQLGRPAVKIKAKEPTPKLPMVSYASPQRSTENQATEKITLAIKISKARATQERLRIAFIALGVSVLATVVIGFILYQQSTVFTAEIMGELSVVRADKGYRVSVEVHTNGPAFVKYPSGQVAVNGIKTVEFMADHSVLNVGENTLKLQVVPKSGSTRTLTLHVAIYYKILSQKGPQKDGSYALLLNVAPGWTLQGAELDREVDGERVFALTTQSPATLVLTNANGHTVKYNELIELSP